MPPFSFGEFLRARDVSVADEVSALRQRPRLRVLCKDAIIVTHEEGGETPLNGGTVRIIPAWPGWE